MRTVMDSRAVPPPRPAAEAVDDRVVVLDPDQVRRGPWTSVYAWPGTRVRVLGPEHADHPPRLLYLDAGASMSVSSVIGPTWLWVVEGVCHLNGRRLRTGACAWVPAHGNQLIQARAFGWRGCLLLSLPGRGPDLDPAVEPDSPDGTDPGRSILLAGP